MEEKGSRFEAFAFPCSSISEHQSCLKELSSRYSDASHIAYAYKYLEEGVTRLKASDDGEPSGTAGRPILNHIDGRQLINVTVFVIRYFGGTKLGAGGLVRAYGGAAGLCLDQGNIQKYIAKIQVRIQVGYPQEKQLDYDLKSLEALVISKDYGANITYHISVPKEKKSELLQHYPQATDL